MTTSTTLNKTAGLKVSSHSAPFNVSGCDNRNGFMFANPCAASSAHGMPWVLYPCAVFFRNVVRFNHQAACEFGLQHGSAMRIWTFPAPYVEGQPDRWELGVFENMQHKFVSRTDIHKHGAYVLKGRECKHKTTPYTVNASFSLSTRSRRGIEVVRQIPALHGRLVRLYSHPNAANDDKVRNWMMWDFNDLCRPDYQRSESGEMNLADDHRFVLRGPIKELPTVQLLRVDDDSDCCPVH